MTIVPTRLLSPTHRRIVDIDPTNEEQAVAHRQLLGFGWTVYTGLGVTNNRGWFIPASDPSITAPLPLAVVKVKDR